MAALGDINRAFNQVPKRAEARATEQLRDTFVDSGVAAALESIDHQVLYGRRGTGKTHALRYLETVVESRGDVAVYLDLRTIGSPDGLFAGGVIPTSERTARLLVDLLGQLHDSLLEAALADTLLIADRSFVARLDALVEAITTIRVTGEVEFSDEGERKDSQQDHFTGKVAGGSKVGFEVNASSESGQETRVVRREARRGTERISLNFSDIVRALRNLADSLTARRVWLILDEWSSIPSEIQPYLGAFLVRCVLPLPAFTVKIAAIEQQTHFRETLPDGSIIGLELGADVAANIDLDEFMVFEQNELRARTFFLGLLFKHLTAGVDADQRVRGLTTEDDLIRLGFTDVRAFDELVRAAEGVPRDAINIAAKAAMQAFDSRISVPNVRAAARTWFQADKEATLRSRDDARRLLNWIVDKVIKEKRARGFLVDQKSTGSPLLMALFDARVLHLVRRGYSAQDEPGERYDVYVIDYGAYVDLIHTKSAPQGVLPGEFPDHPYVDVPTQDLRAIRRAVLDLNAFQASL
jgi:hypothetical protein